VHYLAAIFLPPDLVQQPFGLALQGEDVGADFIQPTQRCGVVEVTGGGDFVADPD